MIDVISVVVLGAVALIGTGVRLQVKRKLEDMDGMGRVTTTEDARIIAKF